jgi:DNA-binding transcriptional regulator YiaG
MRQAKGTTNPSPDEIVDLRKRAKLTQTDAAKLVYVTLRTWQNYEAGVTPMHPGLWKLFRVCVS